MSKDTQVHPPQKSPRSIGYTPPPQLDQLAQTHSAADLNDLDEFPHHSVSE